VVDTKRIIRKMEGRGGGEAQGVDDFASSGTSFEFKIRVMDKNRIIGKNGGFYIINDQYL
jgi:hypothetical protein